MNQIITITDNAVNQIKKIFENAPAGAEGILLGISNSGCSGYSYKLDFIMDSNTSTFDLVDKNGVKIFIDPKATMHLLGSTMDYSTDKLSSKFTFPNPNSKNVCGCGDSFSL